MKWLRVWKRRLLRTIAAILLSLVALGALVLQAPGFGTAAKGERLKRMQASKQYHDEQFHNTQPMYLSYWKMIQGSFSKSSNSAPSEVLPVVKVKAERFLSAPTSGLRVTWLGHSTTLIEIDGKKFLTDPVWGPRTSPFTWIGPERWYAPPLEFEDLPKLDAVLISYDHYDHLDYPTIRRMKDWDTKFVVPIGVGAHLSLWGVPDERIIEMDGGRSSLLKGKSSSLSRRAMHRVGNYSIRIAPYGEAMSS